MNYFHAILHLKKANMSNSQKVKKSKSCYLGCNTWLLFANTWLLFANTWLLSRNKCPAWVFRPKKNPTELYGDSVGFALRRIFSSSYMR